MPSLHLVIILIIESEMFNFLMLLLAVLVSVDLHRKNTYYLCGLRVSSECGPSDRLLESCVRKDV